MLLVRPHVLETHFRRPQELEAQRTRLAVWSLLLAGVMTTFVVQFVLYALRGDADPEGAARH
jgi:hypothetical protein